MNETLARLLALQEVDREIHALRKKLVAEPAALSREQAAVKEAEAEFEKLKAEIRELQKLVDGRNLELRTHEETIKKLEVQAQSLKTNQEYAAMQKQIAGKRGEISGIEDKILEAMEILEKAKAGLPARDAAVKEKKRKLDESTNRVAAEVKRAEAELAAKTASAEERARGIDAERLAAYRWLRERYGPSAVAELSPEGVCQGCFLSVTAHTLNEAMSGAIAVCGSCRRLLHMK